MKREINTRQSRAFRFKLVQAQAAVATLTLEPPDTHHFSAAQGWLELGNWTEASADLARIRPRYRAHPDVLEVKYRVCSMAHKWEEAMIICRTLAHIAPQRPFGWLGLSVALNKLDRPRDACELLRPVIRKFPKDATLRYAMARYSCRLGRLSEALAWLHDAMDLGDPFKFMSAALQDPGLEPLWKLLPIEGRR